MFLFLGNNTVFARMESRNRDALSGSQRTLTDAIKTNNVRMRVAAENMANSQSAGYVPKKVYVQAKRNRKTNGTTVQVKKISRDKSLISKKLDPTHPKADANGMVEMPNISPLMTMMDMQRAKLESEHAMKSYQMTTDMRHATLKMMN